MSPPSYAQRRGRVFVPLMFNDMPVEEGRLVKTAQ
jgi:hypothetical protein